MARSRPASPPEARPPAPATPHPTVRGSGLAKPSWSPLWRLVSDPLDAFLSHYSERYLFTHGPLALHVEKVWNDFLRCGDYNQGVVLLKCPGCETSLAVPYSCKTRICPSRMTRRAEDLAVILGDILPRVPCRYVVTTFPRLMGIRHRVREDPPNGPEAPPVTYGAVSRKRPLPPRAPLQQPRPPLEPRGDDANQRPPGWEDWLD